MNLMHTRNGLYDRQFNKQANARINSVIDDY
jgi:hypothetical protein